MIVEAVRLVADALKDAATGVNEALSAQAVDSGDAVPEIVRVIDAVSDDAAALGEDAADWPVLIVSPGGPFDVDGATPSGRRTTLPTMPVSVAYVSHDSGDPADRLRNGEYTARAVMGVITTMAQPVRNGVCVVAAESFTIDPLPTVTLAGAEVVIEVIANLVVRDTTP